MREETKVAMKIAAIQLAMDGRRDGEDIAWIYEHGQAIYDWLIDDLPEDTQVANVTNLRPV